MSRTRATLSFYINVRVEEREGYFAASTKPFAITVYGDTEGEAEERALEAVNLLLAKYSKSVKVMDSYLNRMDIKHTVYNEEAVERRNFITRESRQEMRLEVPAGAC